jgi:flagellar hook-associated protein 2
MATPLINIGGLASGLDTNAIVEQMMQIERLPRTKLDNKASLVTARQNLLQDFQSRLRAVEAAARDLRSTTLWSTSQSVTSSDPARVGAVIGTGAGVGGYQVEVSQLANSAQRTYAFSSPAADGTIAIDGHDVAVRAGATIDDVMAAINGDAAATVWAAKTDDGTLVLSSRRTGDTGTGFIAVTDGTGALTEDPSRAKQGRDASFTVDGVAGSSSTNEVASAIPGVRLTLSGVTTVSGPVTVNVGAPGADAATIEGKLRAFVDVYNSTVDAIRAKLDEKVVPNAANAVDRQKGLLRGDTMLTGMLAQMRQAIYEPIGGLPEGMDSLADLGISTGSASATISRDALAGRLTVDSAKLSRALASDPDGVEALLAGVDGVGGWARGFEELLHDASGVGGTLSSRIDGAGGELRRLQASMAQMDQRLEIREQTLRAQFTAMEAALAASQSQGQWLAGQLAALQPAA